MTLSLGGIQNWGSPLSGAGRIYMGLGPVTTADIKEA